MTPPSTATAPDAGGESPDAPATGTARRPIPTWVRPVAATTAVLALTATGATVGSSFGADAAATVSASALVQLVQGLDPVLADSSPLRSLPGDTQTFVANETAYLSSPAFAAEAVTGLTTGAAAQVDVTRQGQSEVLAFSASDTTAVGATAAVDSAVKRYTDRRVGQLGQQIQGALDDVQRTLDEIAHSPTAASEAEQQSRVALLREQQAQLLRLRFDGASPVTRLTPTTVDPPPPVDPAQVGALLGGLLGALAGLTAVRLVPRRRAD